MAKRIEREALYDLVWSEPVRTVAARFEVSDVALKKACQRASIPTPDRGYWAKREAGKSVTKIALPPRAPGHSNVITFGHSSYWYPNWTAEELAGPLPPAPTFPEPIDAVRARVERAVGKVKCTTKVTGWHPAIRKLLEKDEDRRKKAASSPYAFSWEEPVFTTDVEQRRLRILNAIFLAVGRCNGKVTVRGTEARDLTITFDRQHVVVALHPEQAGRKPDPAKLFAPLRFSILKGFGNAEVRASWVDESRRPLEDQLASIAVELVVDAEVQLREGALHHHRWRAEQKARLEREAEERRLEAIRKEAERREQEQRERLEALFKAADDYRRAEDIRGFVAKLTRRIGDTENRRDAAFDQWATWALEEANRIDPSVTLDLPGLPKTTAEPPGGW
ncbi:MAG TPA: hypothetical protein VGR32_04960 [Brevundimonas sp.]|uniref:hypothetical protein n=1 Tax=Brevundimonas sp. TaxID=1871086 RepID=UPI002DEF7087|nr:hypothetical protein [Brevundimonas sp.]